MIPEVGSTCLYTFVAKFDNLNGVYRCRAETTFADALASGVNFVDLLYQPAGLTEADYLEDFSSYNDDRILILEPVDDVTQVYYVPESIFLTVPDPTIRAYYPLTMAISLGAYADNQSVVPLVNQINDLVRSMIGVENTATLLTNPDRRIYMTDVQYDAVKADRETRIESDPPLIVQLQQERARNVYLSALVSDYEARLTATP